MCESVNKKLVQKLVNKRRYEQDARYIQCEDGIRTMNGVNSPVLSQWPTVRKAGYSFSERIKCK